jgi:hypothetical protein
MQGAQKLRREAYLQNTLQRRSLSATQQMYFLRNHHTWALDLAVARQKEICFLMKGKLYNCKE